MTTPHPDSEYVYPGDELDLFSQAHHWKGYWHSRIAKYLKGDVLEVGAGIGANTVLLRSATGSRWMCVEPDGDLAKRLEEQVHSYECETLVGTVADLPDGESFDTVLYLDVLEHIEDDAAELARVASCINSGGHLIMLGPAHNFLFSPFDHHVGHFRRYARTNLPAIDPAVYSLVHYEYLDCVGIAASMANRLFLRASLPTKVQIKTWDSFMVPVSKWLDPVFGRRLGKSILVVWRKKQA